MKRVELIWHRGCPNAATARTALMRAFSMASTPAQWQEWCVDDPECPEEFRQYGSPTILIDGKDVDGFEPGSQGESRSACRVYQDANGVMSGSPAVDRIVAALKRDKSA
jgi:mercuric ion transport protein